MNSATIIIIIVACLIILYTVIKAIHRSSRTSNSQYLKTVTKDNSLSSKEEIDTVNSFLYEQEINKKIYIVKQMFFNQENTKKVAYSNEKVFDKGSDVLRNNNEVRLQEAWKYFDITRQNILLKNSMEKTDGRKHHSFTLTLSCVQNIDGISKTTVLRMIDQDSDLHA